MDATQVRQCISAFLKTRHITDMMPPLPEGMVPRQIYVIEAIERLSPHVRVSDVSDLLGVTRPGMTKVIGELEEMGMVKKSQSAKDRRIYYVALTDKGKSLYDYYVDQYHHWLAEKLSAIPEKDVNTMVQTIEAILSIMAHLDVQKEFGGGLQDDKKD